MVISPSPLSPMALLMHTFLILDYSSDFPPSLSISISAQQKYLENGPQAALQSAELAYDDSLPAMANLR